MMSLGRIAKRKIHKGRRFISWETCDDDHSLIGIEWDDEDDDDSYDGYDGYDYYNVD